MDDPSWMSRLPNEVLLMVLSFLSPRDLLVARAVCRRWRDLVPDRRVWWRCSLSVVSMADVPLAMAVLRVAPCLHHLLLDAGMNDYRPNIPRDSMEKVLSAVASVPIASLDLHVHFWPPAKPAIASQVEHLHSLNLSMPSEMYYVGDIFQTASKLKLVQLAVILGREGDNCIKRAEMPLPAPVAPGSSVQTRSLKRLHLTGMILPDAVVESLVRASARSLEEVSIVHWHCPRAVAALAECAGQLTHLDLDIRRGFPALLPMCDKLTSLCLRSVGDDTDNKMSEYFKTAIGLKSLALRGADGLVTLKCLRSLGASGRSSLVHLRLFNHDSGSLPPVEGDERLHWASFQHLRTLRLHDFAAPEFLLRWQSPPALQILDLEGYKCLFFRKCILNCIRVAVKRAVNPHLHVIRFKFMLCESAAAHDRLKCCHQHDSVGERGPAGRKLISPNCGFFLHPPSVECDICSNEDSNVAQWLWSRDDNFNLSSMISKSTVKCDATHRDAI